jgi:hypothetical protein
MSILLNSLANLTDQPEERNRIGGGDQGIVKVNLNPDKPGLNIED